MCVIFVGKTMPTPENIEKLLPVLCNKSIVETMVNFLCEKNPYYMGSVSFSQRNLDALFAEDDADRDAAIPQAVHIAHLPLDEAVRSATSDYTDRNEGLIPSSEGDGILVDAVGYTDGDHTPQNYLEMKTRALALCRQGHPYLVSQSGSAPMCDRDEAFLTSVFPHLDPWGIGALNHPARPHKTSLLRQVQHLLQLHDSPFERDPNFAFVCWNIISKAEVNKSMSFRVKESQRSEVVKDIMSLSLDALDVMQKKWQRNPYARPSSVEEQKALRVLKTLRQMSTHMVGSAGYKQHLRNEIRGMMNVLGTPALFITINPYDVHHPLVRILGGAEIEAIEHLQRGEPVNKFTRAQFVADRSAAAATFFDTMIGLR